MVDVPEDVDQIKFTQTEYAFVKQDLSEEEMHVYKMVEIDAIKIKFNGVMDAEDAQLMPQQTLDKILVTVEVGTPMMQTQIPASKINLHANSDRYTMETDVCAPKTGVDTTVNADNAHQAHHHQTMKNVCAQAATPMILNQTHVCSMYQTVVQTRDGMV